MVLESGVFKRWWYTHPFCSAISLSTHSQLRILTFPEAVLRDGFELATFACVSPWGPYVESRASRELVPKRGNLDERAVVMLWILRIVGSLGRKVASRIVLILLTDDLIECDVQTGSGVRMLHIGRASSNVNDDVIPCYGRLAFRSFIHITNDGTGKEPLSKVIPNKRSWFFMQGSSASAKACRICRRHSCQKSQFTQSGVRAREMIQQCWWCISNACMSVLYVRICVYHA